MPPALPGFHYDAEKKKYFKIQPNHIAAHASARKYSQAALKKEAEEQREQNRRKLFEQKERKMKLRRSTVLASPLGGGCGVTRELGIAKSDDGTIVMRAWAQGLRRKEVLGYRCPDGGGSGAFVFDTATPGVLTYAEACRRGGAPPSFAVFVHLFLICGT